MISGTETVTLLRESPGGFDAYGDPITSTTTRIDVDDCLVAPRTSTEPTERGREGVVTGWQVIAPDGTSALYTDGIEIRGVTCRIEGEVGNWPPMGVVINAVRAVG
jgi:hypothetical protein